MSRLRVKNVWWIGLVGLWGGAVGLGWPVLPEAAGQITYTPTKHSEYQMVNSDGTSAWPPGGLQPYPVEMIGLVINNPWDMLYYNLTGSPSLPYPPHPPAPPNDVPQWQVFFQAVDPYDFPGVIPNPGPYANDFGGTAMYMRKNHPWNPNIYYTDDEWISEMQRLNYPNYQGSPVTEPLRRGDLIKVEAKAPGLFFRGKRNINEQHQVDPAYDFYITILARDVPLAAANITLADLKNPDDTFKFDQTRQTGCERYQGSLVHLDNLLLLDPQNWALNGTVTVKQTVGQMDLTFPLKLGIDPALAAINASLLATTPFSLTAILDQEDAQSPYTDSYRLWLTSVSDLGAAFAMVPEPASVGLLSGGIVLLWILRRYWTTR